DDDAPVEQVGAPAQFTRFQNLRRIALPGIRLAVVAHQAAEKQDRQADVRVVTEQKAVEMNGQCHGCCSGWSAGVEVGMATREPLELLWSLHRIDPSPL